MPLTQSLTAVFYKGQYRIAHWGSWDGYPEGHGLTALEFIRDQMDYDKFTDKLMKLRELSDADRARIAEMMEDDFERQYPHLTQDGDGSEILSVVQDGEDGLPLNNWIYSVGDSSYWQWAYVIDFDKGTFEVYRGFNLEKLDPSERFANAKVEEGSRRYPVLRDRDYQPIKFVTSWRLDALPTNEKFLLELSEPVELSSAAVEFLERMRSAPCCTQLRRMRSTYGIFDDKGEVTTSWFEWETRACGNPLMSEVERTTGICGSCASGWSDPANYPIKS